MENVEKTSSEKILTNSKKDKEIKSICWDMFKLKIVEQEAKQKYAELQTKVKNYFSTNKLKTVQFSDGNKNYKITDVNPTEIVWDGEKLYDKLIDEGMDKDKVKQFISTEVSITDWNSFAEFLKSKGIKAKEVTSFVEIKRKVDTKKVNQLSEIGEITDKDIEGCFEVKEKAGFVKLTDWESKDEES